MPGGAARGRLVGSWTGVTLVAVLLALTPAAPVSAADPGLEVSLDGATWSAELPTALFASLGQVVPGDVEERVVYLRNTSSGPGMLRLNGVDASASSDLFAGALFLRASAPGASSAAESSLAEIGDCAELLGDRVLAAGEVVTVAVGLRFGDLQATQAQSHTATFGLVASLRDPDSVGLSPDDCPAGVLIPGLPSPTPTPPPSAASPSPAPATAGGLPRLLFDRLAATGWTASPLIPTALLMLGAGMFLALASRRRGEER